MYFPSARLRVSLIVACGIAAERLEFTAGFEVVLEDEHKSPDASLNKLDTLPTLPSSIISDDTEAGQNWPLMVNVERSHVTMIELASGSLNNFAFRSILKSLI